MATLIRSDLEFVLQQIAIAEQHAAGADLASLLPNHLAMLGLRTVDGSFNNVVPGQETFGAADQPFPSLVDPFFRPAYAPGNVVDAQPRVISNLISDQTISNPAAVQAFVDGGFGVIIGNVLHYLNEDGTTGAVVPAGVTLTIPNATPDAALSAGFNSWFVFFGQFFDHGLDFIQRSTETVVIPLSPDDPILIEHPGAPPFMVIERTVKDSSGAATNHTTPFVDQNQTYTSHASHQVFLREYVPDANGDPVATGRLIQGANGGMATWADVKAQARTILGIELTDEDVGRVPLVYTDQYGNFIPGPNGFPQLIISAGPPPVMQEGSISTPLAASVAVATGHSFIIDIAHNANPAGKVADANNTVDPIDATLAPGQYDDELLDAHYMAGDGRANENIALTAVHHIFHSEHNRQVDEIKATVLATGDAAFIAQWLVPGANQGDGVQALEWNGERLFQAAKFATEMQYQHLVFEEFARKVRPNIDAFLQYDSTVNPAILAEFAHTVYRFGHSMLTETVDRYDPNFNASGMGLIEAFLNPLAFDGAGAVSADDAAGAIVRGTTRQLGNEIDEFVTEALRNNLLGLPLDLATINLARGREAGVPTLNAARAEFFRGTSDSQLKPYTSWADFAGHLKHPESLINFIAAYGTHAAITGAMTLADKRAAATLLVLGDGNDGDGVTIGSATYTDRLAFLNSTGTWANSTAKPKDIDGVTNTGLGNVDLWIGGLAEKQMPFGGLLGSTFNFVFETQLESLQNGDRFYYLGRLAGTNFFNELENNSFAKLIMANTNATHLPADVFSTPAWILEVDRSRQFNDSDGDGVLDSNDPVGGSALVPLVIRDNPATPGTDTNYLRYTGPDHVVLGGTNPGNAANPSGNDILIASEGDDTVWGDGGNDRIEGGFGNDQLNGGDGDDIITDMGGDDVIKGEAGNDVIFSGNGLNLVIAGAGKDFIVNGEGVSEVFGGLGDDFIYGNKVDAFPLGNEGNDWIELGTQDGAVGDNFDPLTRDLIKGHDVFIGGGGFDEMLGEGGDDVFVGSEGEDHYDGNSGFDWATYRNDTLGVTLDMIVSDFIEPKATPSNAGILDRFAFVEGLSGGFGADVLRGDDQTAANLLNAGAQGSVLTAEGIALISGLQELIGAGVTSFGGGNIILGGAGSDIIEGRAGDDIIDGDKYLNVRISVRTNADGTGPELRSVNSMSEIFADMQSGAINPGQLVIVREILQTTGLGFDTAVYSAPLVNPVTGALNYTIATAADGTITVTDNRIVGPGVPRTDGVDTLQGIERLQFADQAVVLPAGTGLNTAPVGQLGLSDTTPSVNQLITANALAIRDADNIAAGNAAGAVRSPVSYYWQVQLDPVNQPGVFTDIAIDVGGLPTLVEGPSFRVTPDLDGLQLRVRAVYKDGHGVLENVYSAPATVAGTIAIAPTPPVPAETQITSAGNGVHFIRGDLDFILDQIKIAERHAGGEALTNILPNSRGAFGLRTVDGSFNNVLPGQEQFGAADQSFPVLVRQTFRNENDEAVFTWDPDGSGPAPAIVVSNTNYASLNGTVTRSVVDSDPRTISNLVVDQTPGNFAAVAASGGFAPVASPGRDGIFGTADDVDVFLIANQAPDAALSAQFNSWFTFFGQFFDHGLDLVDKGGHGSVFIPLAVTDPLYNPDLDGADNILGNADDPENFMVISRATNTQILAGADGLLGTADDIHRHNNETTPFVDQNQTYTSHPSHQVFLREYALVDHDGNAATALRAMNTGHLIDGANGGIANWAEVKAQAASILGIRLTDRDIDNVPLVRTDLYGNFIPNANGAIQLIVGAGADGIVNTADDVVVAGNRANPVDPSAVGALRSGHAFLNDIAHTAVPVVVNGVLQPDTDTLVGNAVTTNPLTGLNTRYDNELLDKHFITGDGRGNENIGLTAVHFVFHAEHNRLVEHVKQVAVASNDVAFLNQWLLRPVTALPTTQAQIDALPWNGQRLFQAARFGTEMQYQHLVFEEFGRKISPEIDPFFAATQVYDTQINPAIVAEFAHVVYRFGHSMLTETVDRFDALFNVISADPLHPAQNASDDQIGLISAFLNPLAFTASGATDAQAAGAIVRGVTRQAGNEIDEFVTEALRNNLVGLPLDLPAINIARGREAGVPTLNEARAQFFTMSGDSALKPYASWIDFGANLKHLESLVNFVAAYGTHASITAEATTAGKRAAAYAIVYGADGMDGLPGTGDEPTVAVPPDRLDFLSATGSYAGGTLGGLDTVDLWIGGLAEKQMPFGGLLGSTFNFVFENQLEKLQDGDRFYYLERTQGMNFLSELEGNSFAKLIMANTDATHLPGNVFSTPAFTLEVDQSKQFTGLGLPGTIGRDDPLADDGSAIVFRSDPAAPSNPNYLKYTGPDHVVLGGTANNDTLIASEGDDTLYGDGGNDRLEGGDGNDMIFGGVGDDIITDTGGDDILQGQDGNDAIHGGNGINLIIGGFGSDFIVSIEDGSEEIAGPGNDFILGGPANEFVFGNEGDDWIEAGMVDGAAGDNFDALGRDLVRGNDVFIGHAGFTDRMDGEGGDDIMAGNGGEGDRYEGFSGFDWAMFRDAPSGTTADLTLIAFNETPLPPTTAILARFASVEGLSGSAHGDVLRGDHATAASIPFSGAYGSVLQNISLINGLQSFLDTMLDGNPNVAGDQPVTSFGAGNIILGGAGSDIIEGRGGDDVIDGDLYLSVRLTGLDVNGQAFSAFSMSDISARVFAGEINPGAIRITRELLLSPTRDFDTAVFSGALFDADGNANYAIAVNGVAVTNLAVPFTIANSDVVTVTDLAGLDGTDTLRNIERLEFTDRSLIINGTNAPAAGLLHIDDATPTQGQLLTVDALGVTDANNVSTPNPMGAITGPITYTWQQELSPGDGDWQDIVFVNEAPATVGAIGPTFRVTEAQVGLSLRVKGLYKDANGVLETVYSAPTAAVANVNDLPVGVVTISDATPTETRAIVAVPQFTDADGLTTAIFTYQWQQAVDAGVGGSGAGWQNVGVASTNSAFTPGQAQVNRELRVVVTYTDDRGTLSTVTSAATIVTGDFIAANLLGQILAGTEGQDVIFGGGGVDTINAGGQADVLDGGTGADTINAGAGNDRITGGLDNDVLNGDAGNDQFLYAIGDGADQVNGGADADTLRISGTAVNNTLAVLFNGTALTTAAGSLVTGVEVVAADLLGGTDTLTYAGSTAAVTVNLATGTASGFAAAVAVPADGSTAALPAMLAIAGIENVIGTGNADTLTGDANANGLDGGAGNDVLTGGGGADSLVGGIGDDRFVATVGDGNDNINGGTQTDTYDLSGTSAGATVTVTLAGNQSTSADTGTDVLVGIENIIGSLGNDIITMGTGTNVIDGMGGADTINGGAGDDIIRGGAGNDIVNYTMGQGADAVDGGADSDTLNVIGAANDVLDVIFNGTAITLIEGGAVAGIEAVTANLGGGVDTLSYTGTTAGVVVNLAAGTASGFTTIAGIDNATGGGGNDLLTGTAGNNSLNGGDGNDTLDGNGGNDNMVGGGGNDTYTTNGGDVLTEAVGGGTDTVISSITFSFAAAAFANFENLTLSGAGAINGTGNALDNVIQGNSGNNVLNGGTNTAFGDTLSYANAAAGVTVSLAVTTAQNTGGAGTDTISNFENLTGSNSGDTLTGSAVANRITGGGGNDVMTGNGGNDLFIFAAGFGQDTIQDFDSDPAGGQDLLDFRGSGLTFADVAITGTTTTTITVGTASIVLTNVNSATVDQSDFLFA